MNLRPPIVRRARRGFTLLELTLASAIMAVLLLALYASLTTAFRARRTTMAQTGMMRQVAVTLDLIEQDFQSILPASETRPFTGIALGTATSSADAVSFYCLGRDASAFKTTAAGAALYPMADGMRLVEISLRTDPAGQPALVRRVWRNLYATILEAPEEEVIARGVSSFMVNYYDGSQWYTEWDPITQEYQTPVAVTVVINMTESDLARSARDARGEPQKYQLSRTIPLACGVPISTVAGFSSAGGAQ